MSSTAARVFATFAAVFSAIAKTGDLCIKKIPIKGDFTLFRTVVTLQQIFVILYKDEF